MQSNSFALLLSVAAMSSGGLARDIAPANRPQPPVLGQVIDRTRPAVIPKFLARRAQPSGLAERAWAIQFCSPAFGYCGFGYGYGGFGCGGFTSGGFGFGLVGGGFGGNWAPGGSFETGGSLP